MKRKHKPHPHKLKPPKGCLGCCFLMVDYNELCYRCKNAPQEPQTRDDRCIMYIEIPLKESYIPQYRPNPNELQAEINRLKADKEAPR